MNAPRQKARPARPARVAPAAQTLVKYLVSAGVGSRRHCAELVVGGSVHVNGAPADSLSAPVGERDRVEVDGAPVRRGATGNRYLLMNKPAGCLCTVRDDRGRPTVMDLVAPAQRVPGLVPAGRLDLGSTGLLLLTNDGELVNRVTHPRYGVQKEYRVLLDGALGPRWARALLSGVELPGGQARALAVRRLASPEHEYRYSVTLVEGKKHEVRLMLRAAGRRVLELERVRIGNVRLGDLAPGALRPLTAAELAGLRVIAGERPHGGPAARRAPPKRTARARGQRSRTNRHG